MKHKIASIAIAVFASLSAQFAQAQTMNCKVVTSVRTIKQKWQVPNTLERPEHADTCIINLNIRIKVTDGSLQDGYKVRWFDAHHNQVGTTFVTIELDSDNIVREYQLLVK